VQVTLKVKAIADVMEALIGAFYLEGGMRGAVAAIQVGMYVCICTCTCLCIHIYLIIYICIYII
jgi:hypothetical protein